MLACFLSCFSVLDRLGASLAHSSPLLGFLKLVVAQIEGARRKKFYRQRSQHAESSKAWWRMVVSKTILQDFYCKADGNM